MPWKWTQRARENITARWRKFTRPTPTFPVRLRITQTLTNEMHRIGGSSYGNIYSGRAVTPNGKTIRVAIKVFYSPPSNRRAQAYQRIIQLLQRAGVRIPKMGMARMTVGGREQWVQVSHLYGSTIRGSKIVNKSLMKFQTPEQRMEAIIQLTRIGNAGFTPHRDVIEPFIESRKGVMPIDIDLIAVDYEERKTKEWKEIGKKLTFWIEQMTDDSLERHQLALAAHREAKGPFRKYIPLYNGK